MRKEVIFAIVAGVAIGLIFAFGAWKTTQVIKSKSTTRPNQTKTIEPKKNISLTLDNLIDFEVFTKSPITLAGFSLPLTDIIVSTIDADFYTKTDQDGAFSIEAELPAGLSEIIINEKKFLIVYSSEFEKYLNVEEEQQTSTDEAKTLREQIVDKLSNKNEKGTFYLGTITDISSGTIQIKGKNGEILQSSVSDDTTYVNTLKKNAEVKITDLAIGDYIVEMGFKGNNKVLEAKRILVTSPLTESKLETRKFVIESLTKTKINDITLPKTWVGPNVKELEVGQEIITVGTKEGETYTLRTIFTVVE
jgi:hypothetical protein